MIETAGSVRQALDRPMPSADAVIARLAAARVAGLAGELRRVQDVLSGELGGQVGWAGARQKIVNVGAAPEREAGEKIEDDGEAYQRIVQFLEQLKVV